jgi:hypothetical protein
MLTFFVVEDRSICRAWLNPKQQKMMNNQTDDNFSHILSGTESPCDTLNGSNFYLNESSYLVNQQLNEYKHFPSQSLLQSNTQYPSKNGQVNQHFLASFNQSLQTSTVSQQQQQQSVNKLYQTSCQQQTSVSLHYPMQTQQFKGIGLNDEIVSPLSNSSSTSSTSSSFSCSSSSNNFNHGYYFTKQNFQFQQGYTDL